VEQGTDSNAKPRANSRLRALGLITVLVLLAVLVVVIVLVSQPAPTPTSPYKHPVVSSQTPCSSCKVANHRFVHKVPYQGDCRRCHTTTSWRFVSYTHTTTAMDQGMHAVIGCARCHTVANPVPDPSCGSCHESKHAALPSCEKCHEPISWRLFSPIPAGHVSLQGGHEVLTCFSCHIGPKAFTAPKQCVSCHGVKHGGLTQCGMCHDPSLGWKPKGNFDHNQFYVLSGLHRLVPCAKCHPGGNFGAANPRCVTCHKVRHGGLTDCASCHTTAGFKPSTFRHSSVFDLTGAHARLRCTACHPGQRYATNISTGPGCSGCHGTRHGGLTQCQQCHTTTSFKPSTFRHSSVFVLSGAHASLACTECHPGSRYASSIRKGPGCTGCHGSAHGGLTDCAHCHTQTSFIPSTFKHSSVWPLTGAHATLACTKCHPGGDFTDAIGTSTACVSCHGVHHGNQTACANCHTTTSWSPIKKIAHPGFPPLGAEHTARPCTLCHPTLVFNAPTKPCSDCHTAPHVGPTDCLRCHRPTVWSDIHFTHSEIGYHTGLPIEDACLYCHTTGDYTKYRCDQCHLPY